MQRGILKSLGTSGEVQMAMLFGEPLPLSQGESSWHLFAAATKFCPMLRRAGHSGVAIFHLATDRAV
eukprot:2358640-Lingulodinium_polyedra.AAC.1